MGEWVNKSRSECRMLIVGLHAPKIKCPADFGRQDICAQDWIRTSTPLRAPPPQSGLSTSFNTWAFFSMKKNDFQFGLQISGQITLLPKFF